MKKLMILTAMVMVMVFTLGSVVSAQYHPTKVKWYGKCSQESWKGRQFHKKYTKRVGRQILAQHPKNFHFVPVPIPGSEKYVRRR